MKEMKLSWYTIEEVEAENNPVTLTAMAFVLWGNCYLECRPNTLVT